MLSIVVKWWIKPDREDNESAVLKELVSAARDQEPFTMMYLIRTAVADGSRPRPPSNGVVVVSGWPARAAFERHLNDPVFTTWLAKDLDLFPTDSDGLYVAGEFIDRQVGFIRPSATGVEAA